MPSNDPGPGYCTECSSSKEKLEELELKEDELSKWLYDLCKQVYSKSSVLIASIDNGGLQTWFEEREKQEDQKKAKQKRQEREKQKTEKEKAKKEKLKKEALSRLTPEEKKALGIKD